MTLSNASKKKGGGERRGEKQINWKINAFKMNSTEKNTLRKRANFIHDKPIFSHSILSLNRPFCAIKNTRPKNTLKDFNLTGLT